MADDAIRASGVTRSERAARPAVIRGAAAIRTVAEQTATRFGSWIGRLPVMAVDLALAATLLVAMVTERVAAAPGIGDHIGESQPSSGCVVFV